MLGRQACARLCGRGHGVGVFSLPDGKWPGVGCHPPQALAAHAYCGHTAESLAELLHLAPRSLHRQLQQAGTSLQQLKDEVRRQKACALLLRTDMPLKRIAQACGFASEKSFGRAFAHWLGMPPQQFRAAQRP